MFSAKLFLGDKDFKGNGTMKEISEIQELRIIVLWYKFLRKNIILILFKWGNIHTDILNRMTHYSAFIIFLIIKLQTFIIENRRRFLKYHRPQHIDQKPL